MRQIRKQSISEIIQSLKSDFFVIFLAIMALFASVPIITYIYFAKDLTSKEAIMNKNTSGVILVDRNKKPFFTFYQAKNTQFIPFSQIPSIVRFAVIASEDKDFYDHQGFSVRAIMRAFIDNLRHQDTISGGSTITQQLVKNSLLTSSKNYLRKYQEVVLAQEIERRYSKNEILEMYLNSVYFGEGAFGIEEAAHTYFGKAAQELSLSEASLLAGILPAPSQYSPLFGSKELAKQRQRYVLKNMLAEKYITEKEKENAEKEPITTDNAKDDVNTYAPHFALLVRDELIKRFGEERIARSGFHVHTTLDLPWQEYAEAVVAEQVKLLAVNKVTNGAVVVIDPKNGEIRVMVGSYNWHDKNFGKVNVAVTERQPGSSFKPIVYAAGFEEQLITPATQLHDVPTTFPGGYKPKDYDGQFRGNVTVRRALANSLNIPAVEVMSKVGLINAMEMAQRLGITTLREPSNYGYSLVLGAGEVKLVDLTTVYAAFANNGIYSPPVMITNIEDKFGHLIYTHTKHTQNVLDAGYAYLISSILSDNNARAEEFGNVLTISRPAAVKTGTTEDYRDALTVGYTPSLTVGVWVGNNDNSPMDKIAGSLGAAPIWKRLMEKYLEGTPIESFIPPATIIRSTICYSRQDKDKKVTTFSTTEYFYEGTQPSRSCITTSKSEKKDKKDND